MTETQEVEQALAASERRYRTLLEHSSDGVVILDQTGLIQEVNERFCEIIGLGAQAVVGRVVTDLLHPDERSAAARGIAAVAAGNPQRGERRLRRLDGSYLPVEIRATQVERGRILGIVRDVSERRQAEAASRATEGLEARLHRVASNAPVTLWALDRQGIITLVQGSGLAALGVEASAIVGKSVYEVFPDLPTALKDLDRVFAGESFAAVAEGRGRVLEFHYWPERDQSGIVVGASGLTFDVTDRQLAKRRLRVSEERFRKLAEHISHGLWIATPDLTRMIYTNPSYARIHGHEPERFSQTPAAWVRAIHPEDRDRVKEETRRWSPSIHTELVYRIVRPDGAVRWVRDLRFAIRDKTGTMTEVAGLVEDVTDARRVGAQVRTIQDHLADAQRIAHVGNWDWDIATDELWLSEEACRILGRATTEETVPLERFLSVVHPEDRPAVAEALDAARRSGARVDVHHRLLGPDGTLRIARERAEVTIGSAGEPVRVIGTLQDLTESHRAETAVAMLSSAVEQSADMVFITDREGRIEYVNPAFESHTGYTRDEAVGATPRILKADHPQDALHSELWKTVLSGRVYRGVVVNRKKSGELFSEEKTVTPIRDALGRITQFVSVGRDITERQRAEDARSRLQETIAKAADEWRATFDAVESPLVLLGSRGLVKRLNRAARDLWGGTYEGIIGRPIPGERGEPWDAMTRVADAVRLGGASMSTPAEDPARRRTWDVSASPVVGPEGTRSVIVLVRDISGIVALQESLRRSERMSAMGALVAGVAHEVRNPLFGISAALDAFESDFGDREEYREYLSLLRGEVRRLTGVMQDLLNYGSPSAEALAEGGIGEVIERAVRSCSPLARSQGVEVSVDLAGDLPNVRMEASRLEEVFQNMIENAIQHSPPSGTVGLSAVRTSEGTVVCTVSDSGPGFRDGDFGKVFEPFFTRRRGGTGLGLSIVQKIVEQHGGTVAAANDPEGGAVVTVTLPAVLSR